MKKVCTILFNLSLLITTTLQAQTATAPTSGDGSSGSPYQIATVDNLYWLSQNSSYWGKCFTQTANIDASGISNFSPIGNSSTYFTGTYNGNGHTISGLTISRSTTSLVGLFGKTNNATISNLGITGASVSGYHYTGILSGTCNGTTTVSQCFATGTVNSTGSSVGGLIGELASGGTVTNCYAIATVSTTASANIGGLIGFNYATVSYCYASAAVTASGGSIGGLLGNSTTISSASYYNSGLCSSGSAYATAKTAAELQTESTFSGWNFSNTWTISQGVNSSYPVLLWQFAPGGDGSSSNPYQISSLDNLKWLSGTSGVWGLNFIQTADINASSTSSWHSGSGFSTIGNSSTNFSGTYNGNKHTINGLYINRASDSYVGMFGYTNNAQLKNLEMINVSVSGGTYTGGLVGCAYGSTVIQCCNVSGTVSAAGVVDAFPPHWGIVITGSVGMVITGLGGAIGGGGSETTICSIAGGLAGCSYGTIQNCYAMVDCSSSSTTGVIRIGGLSGANYGTIQYCYATGAITGSGSNGGLIGLNGDQLDSNCSVTNSLWNTQISGQTSGCGYGVGSFTAKGKITKEMKSQATYITSGWDFYGESANGTTDIWAMSSEANNGYPCFIWKVSTPLVSTNKLYSVPNDTSVNVQGTINYLGTSAVSAYGFCWSTVNSVPTITSDSVMNLGTISQTGDFQATITGLSPVKNYYLRAYATNLTGTDYGDVICFTTSIIGSGTSDDPYEVATLKDLQFLSEHNSLWSYYYIQTADINADSTKYWNSGAGFLPIGDATINFTGQYNGQGHVISGLYINRPSESYIGLFGYASGAVISTLGLTKCNITGYQYVGSLSGLNVSSTTISKCYTIGSVKAAYRIAGGLTGEISDGCTVTNCYTLSDITVRSNYGGGLAGCLYGTLSYCYAASSVSGSGTLGGMVAKSTGTITGCVYNNETSPGTTNYGEGHITNLMKTETTFTNLGWNFTDTWAIRNDSTYPALRALDNAPFTFNEVESGKLNKLIQNDFDFETRQQNLVMQIDSAISLKTGIDYAKSINSIIAGDSLRICYRAGEIRIAKADTLWGNTVTSYIVIKNSSPVLTSTTLTTAEDTQGKLLLATDADNDKLSYIVLTDEVNGTAIIRNDSLVYTPNANFYSNDSLHVTVSDGLLSNTAWVHITVTSINDAPVARDTVMTSFTATATTISLPVTDLDGTISKIYIDEYPVKGTVTVSGAILTYTSNASFTGNDTITWFAKDNEGLNSNTATLIITVGTTTSINETSLSKQVIIYPNPCANSFSVNAGQEPTILYLNDINGRLLLKQTIQDESTINVSVLKNGVYIVKVKGESYKLIKK
jgi:hypothetical protein